MRSETGLGLLGQIPMDFIEFRCSHEACADSTPRITNWIEVIFFVPRSKDR